MVRVHFGPPLQKRAKEIWGFSSAGRAPALQAGGQRFDPANLHHKKRLTEVANERKNVRSFIESLAKGAQTCTLKTEHCELLMQL